MKNIFKRVEFWIFIFFLVRLIGITNPPLEIGHNWRQATGLMVSRNFLETDNNIMYPRVDENGGNSGIIGMEFPSMNYIYYLISKWFGYSHWYGRLINLIISSLGLLFFYKILILEKFAEKHAFTSTIILASSIWFAFSRKMMPDTYCISLMMIGLYYGFRFIKESKTYQIILYVIITSLAILSKIPAGIYLIFLIPVVLQNKDNLKAKLILITSTLIPLALTYFWYFYWNLHLSMEFGNWYNIGKPLSTGFNEIKTHIGETLDNFYFDAFYSYIFFISFIIGLIIMFIKKDKKMLITFFLPFVVFVLYMFKSGFYFYHHNYYIIPFVPVMAIVAGYSISMIKKNQIYLSVLILGVVEGIANQQNDFFIKNSQKYKMSLEPIMDGISKNSDLIVINGNGNPQLIYLSHRKGWNCNNEDISDTLFLKKIINKGCKYIVIDKHSFQSTINLPYKEIFENEDFLIYSTNEKNK